MRKSRSRRGSARCAAASRSFVEGLERRVLLSRATGIDVSEFQGSINWTSVKNTGTNFAYIRATYGMTSNDANVDTNAVNAANAGMTIGFYHYAYYDLANHTPAVEAANFWDEVKQYYKSNGKYLMPMLDLEEGSALGSGTGESNLSQWAEAWCSDIIADAAAVGLRVVPIIYCSSSPAGSYFDGTPPKTIPLWVANYTGTTSPQTDQPTAGTGDWQTWQMWQYKSTGSVSGISGNVDMDVLNGDTTTLKDYIVSATSAAANAKFPANTTIVTTTGVNAYNTLADAQNQTNNFTGVASGTVGTIISGPQYGGSYQRYKVTFKNGVTGYVGEDFMALAATPAAVTLSTPANNAHLTASPTSLTWTASANATSYGVYLDGVLKTTTSSLSYNPGALADGTHTWHVKAINSQASTDSSTNTFILDTTPPTATLPTQSPTGGSSTFQFTVNYADATSGVNASTLGNDDITVTGPNGFSQAATFVSYNAGVATYQITAPNSIWNAAANGTYTVSQNASSVKDNYGNARPAGSIGTFVANTFAYLSGSTLVVDYGTVASSMTLSSSGTNLLVQQGSNTDTFDSASVTGITVSGSATGDTFTYTGPITQPVSLNLGGVTRTVNVNAGTMTIVSDVQTDAPGLTLNVTGGAEVDLGINDALASLSINGGKVVLNPSSPTTLTISGNLSIGAVDTLDLGDAQLFTSLSTTAVQAYLKNGYDSGKWDGTGGIISTVAANAPASALLSLGYADSTEGTKATIPAGMTLVELTTPGDADLSGTTDFGDFLAMQNNFNKPGDWATGDFDYNGIIDFNDFLILQNNLNRTAVLPTAAPSAATASTASATPTTSSSTTTQTTDPTPTTVISTTSNDPVPTDPKHRRKHSLF